MLTNFLAALSAPVWILAGDTHHEATVLAALFVTNFLTRALDREIDWTPDTGEDTDR